MRKHNNINFAIKLCKYSDMVCKSTIHRIISEINPCHSQLATNPVNSVKGRATRVRSSKGLDKAKKIANKSLTFIDPIH